MKSIDLQLGTDEHEAPITSVGFNSEGRLATGSYDGSVRVWPNEAGQGSEAKVFRHRRLVNAVAWNPQFPNLLATGSADKTVAVWDVDSKEQPLRGVLSRHTDDVNSVTWMPDGRRLVCVSEDGHVTIWDATRAELLGNLGAHRSHCMAAAANCRGDIASVGEDGLVRVTRDPASSPGVGDASTSRQFEASIEGCAWSADGDLLALAADDGSLEVVSGQDLSTIERHEVSTSAVRSVAWSPDGNALVVGTYDGGVYHIDRASGSSQRHENDRAWPRSVALHGDTVAVGSFSSRPHVYSRSSGAGMSTSAGRGVRGPNAMTVAGDNLVVGTDSGEVIFLDLTDLAQVRVEKMADSPILGLSAAGGTVVGTTYSGRAFSVAPDGRRTLSAHLGAPLPSVAVVEGRVLAGSYGGELIALDLDNLEPHSRTAVHGGSIKSIAPLPDGRVVTAATDHSVSIIEGEGSSRRDLWLHGNLVNSVAQLDGKFVASASRDRTVRFGAIREVESGVHPVVLLGPDESIKSVCLVGTSEKPVVVAGSYDFGVYAWRIDTDTNSADQLTDGTCFDRFDQAISVVVPVGPMEFVVGA